MSLDTPAITEPPTYPPDPTPPVTLVLTILLLVMFFVGFFSIYFCRCFMDNLVNSLNNRQVPNGAPINPNPTPLGLDSETVEGFPKVIFGTLKEYHPHKYALECAICLCEYSDNDVIRVLPICDHIFHIQCIDLWFESHKSCPVCRRLPGLKEDEQLPEKLAHENVNDNTPNENEVVNNNQDHNEGNNIRGDAIINIGDDTQDQGQELAKEEASSSGTKRLISPYINEKFSRSHSTGHSLLKINLSEGGDEKYTLKLPKEVKENITRRHIAALSCTTFGDFSNKDINKHDVFGEVSEDTNKNVNNV
ncbi:hypothetical protein RND81_06G217900 [Saponaria officinalis]|uniref:RING-type E3 ubiquitin transferase n=1 Tax=Saponaria officinalis TaxID=3572 RepID=A0AAW1KDR3_SAPOF